jgi:hypothetical protein
VNKIQLTERLSELLGQCPDTAFFLEGVEAAIEEIYEDDDDGCPDGFEALDAAVKAFEERESDDDEEGE